MKGWGETVIPEHAQQLKVLQVCVDFHASSSEQVLTLGYNAKLC